MINKIDRSLWFRVSSLSNKNDEIDCIIYTNNMQKTIDVINKRYGIYSFINFPFINALGIRTKPDNITALSKMECVRYITSENKVFAQMDIAKQFISVDKLYSQGYYGKNVNACIIDTGISNHIDFLYPKSKIIYFKDFVNNNEEYYDDNGHGTFIAGVLAGSGFSSGYKYAGIAPETNIISLKVLNADGETGAFKVLDAMQWVYDNHKKYNISVVCMSFGSSPMDSEDPLSIGAEALWNAGITVVCAAGNSGPESMTIKSPGISRKIITVGALYDGRNDDKYIDAEKIKIADFSSRGPSYNYYKPDLVAPGVNITSTCCKDKLYTSMSGTSVSTPIIAGVCCLIKEKYPNITPYQIKMLLTNNCISLTKDRNNEGYGYLHLNKI